MSSSSENYVVGEKKRKGKAESHTVDVPKNGYMEDIENAFWQRQSINKMHNYIKDRYENIYNPLLISIGPYHHGMEHLLPMEEHKRRACSHFIWRSRVPVEDYKSALMEDVQTLKEAYEQLDGKYWVQTDTFIEVMLVDGCFILEFMDILSGAPKDHAPNDPIFGYYGFITNYRCVMRDLLLMENQLPYLVLEKLVLVSEQRHLEPGKQRVPATLSQMMMSGRNMELGRHLLEIFRFRGIERIPDNEHVSVSASQLHQVGIEFKKVDGITDICFDRSLGTLNLPHIDINDYSTSTLYNLKACELWGNTTRDFNSYIRLMESLIKTPRDVKLLEMKGILVHSLDSDESVVKLLKDLKRDTVVDMHCSSYMAREGMTVYYEVIMRQWKNRLKSWLKSHLVEWISNLKQTYFSNPWSIISVVAAFCLLVLTVLQTIYTIRSFYQGK